MIKIIFSELVVLSVVHKHIRRVQVGFSLKMSESIYVFGLRVLDFFNLNFLENKRYHVCKPVGFKYTLRVEHSHCGMQIHAVA